LLQLLIQNLVLNVFAAFTLARQPNDRFLAAIAGNSVDKSLQLVINLDFSDRAPVEATKWAIILEF
jgi:hypothetical protein